ncbi:catalase family peroxidase [Methylocapsa sp. D3K7]|uniref:catalase family peroxidase n=1 Tax=Methylocapsa sp. D3K7 TaxID=3041435 RepID=UPI00244EE7F5|nr:catalase family peroxidase [Methylocapsa sp. D3K7]WGJ15874.1 catalase family peroxidase [Methylocapsa sp. D3K7]
MAIATKIQAVAALLLTAWFGPAVAQDTALETEIVDAMNKVYGVHPGFRANHAKGVVAEGSFKAAPTAARLSKAVIFTGSPVPVTVRFSDSTGVPNLPDGSRLANPHGLAIKYHLADGSETDMVINSLKFFPVSSGEDFRDMLLAVAESPPGAPKPTKLDEFAAKHPSMPKALATVETPDSFADEEYYGVNAFVLVNDKGERRAVRYIMAPDKLVHLSEADAAKAAPDFLIDELPARLARGPVTFHLKAQLASPGDSTKDASVPWPSGNEIVELGVLTIDKPVSNSLEAQKTLLFLPGQLVEGIEPSDDPLIGVRDGAYAVSFSRRNP